MMRRKSRGKSATAARPDQRQNAAVPEGAPAAPTRVLFVPERIVHETWRAFEVGARLGVESSVRWAGPAFQVGAPQQVVTSVIIPHQQVNPGFFAIPHEATRAMGDALGELGLVNLAQLHTHPGASVTHSVWDDAHAYSSRSGALSIVWPYYGHRLPSLAEWGVHECRPGNGWVRLHAGEVSQRIIFVRESIDLRMAFEFTSGAEGAIDGTE